MSEAIKFREAKLEAGWLMVKPEREDLGLVLSFLRKKKDKQYSLEMKEFRKKRSMDANAYAWVLINKLADALRIPPTEVYRQAIQDIPGNSEVVPVKEEAAEQFKQAWSHNGLGWLVKDLGASKIKGYRNLMLFYGSSVYSKEQQGVLIDHLVQDCKSLDIETLPPEKLALLKEEWS